MEIIKATIEFLTHDRTANRGHLHRVKVGDQELTRGQLVVALGEFIDDRAQLEIEVHNYRARNEGLLTANSNLRQQIASMNTMARQMNEQFREAAERATRIDMSATDYLMNLEDAEKSMLRRRAEIQQMRDIGLAFDSTKTGYEQVLEYTKNVDYKFARRVLLEPLASPAVPAGATQADIAAAMAASFGVDIEKPTPHGAMQMWGNCPSMIVQSPRVDGNGRNRDTDLEADGDHDQGAQ